MAWRRTKPRALEAGDDAAHGGWPDLLGVGELAERLWSAEDEDGKGGKLGRADVSFAVADAKAAEQVDGGGVELVGDFRSCVAERRDASATVTDGEAPLGQAPWCFCA